MRDFSRDKRIRHGFALQLKLTWLRNFRDSDIQVREEQFTHLVGLLQMRVARQDKAVDPQRRVFINACRYGWTIADQRRTGAAAHQTHPGPQVRADLKIFTLAVVQGGHSVLAHGVVLANAACALAIVSSSR